MANAFKQAQQDKRDAQHDALVRECRAVAYKSNRVAALRKYMTATGASLEVAQQALWGTDR